MVFPLVLSALFFCLGHDRNDRRLLVLSGFLAGCAMVIKTVSLPYLLLLAGSGYFFFPGKRSCSRDITNIALFLLPSLCLAFAITAYFYYQGALPEFLYWNITVPMAYSHGGAGFTGPPLRSILSGLSHELLPLLFLASTGSVWLLLRQRNLNNVLIVLLFPVSWVAALLPGMNLPHYFIQTVPFMAITGALGLHRLFIDRRMAWIVLSVFLMLTCNYVRKDFKFFVTMPMAEVSRYKFGPDFVSSIAIAEYIRQRTGPDDFIFQWGFEPELYILSGRRPPLPYISSTIMKMLENREAATEHLANTLAAKKPKYIIYQDEWADCPGVVDIRTLLDRYYKLEIVIGYGKIFRLNETL